MIVIIAFEFDNEKTDAHKRVYATYREYANPDDEWITQLVFTGTDTSSGILRTRSINGTERKIHFEIVRNLQTQRDRVFYSEATDPSDL